MYRHPRCAEVHRATEHLTRAQGLYYTSIVGITRQHLLVSNRHSFDPGREDKEAGPGGTITSRIPHHILKKTYKATDVCCT